MVAANSTSVEVSWDAMIDGHFPKPEPAARRIFRETLAKVADKAKQALPQSNGRVDKAVQIVLAGDVVPCEDGRFFVGSQSDTTTYIVLDNACDCPDYDKAPEGVCKHVLATMLWRRAYPLAKARVEALDHSPAHASAPQPAPLALPEAPASVNVYVEMAGRKVQVTLRDSDETRLLSRLEALLTRFPAESNGDKEPPEGWCSMHQVQMTRSKDGKGYYHKAGEKPDGKAIWCRGK